MRFASIIFLFLCLSFTGCKTVPVKTKFPEIPEKLLVKCPNLKKIEEDVKLSDITKTITLNYSTYYECAVKHDGMVEWYQIQKQIFDEANK